MTLSTPALRFLRNLVIALLVALAITLTPIVRSDTVKFVRTVFGAPQPSALVKADLTH